MPASPGFRIFVLGAGFSRSAGLPLAAELFPKVRTAIENRYGSNTKFDRDLGRYLKYLASCTGQLYREDCLDLEEFMSYLDIEHFLELRGSDAWSQEGNESQLMIRRAIGEVIHRHTPPAHALPDFYYRFADNLSPSDLVLTFNYDLVLEHALRHVGKPFRRYPDRIVDSAIEEVVILKLHGSLDWFDDRQFLQSRASLAEKGIARLSLHSVFDDPSRYGAHPLVEEVLSESDSLRHLHWIRNVDDYYHSDRGFNAPFILSPSHVKFVYAEPLLSFWNGLGRIGGNHLGVSVIGFSLPDHDEYIRIGLYHILSNYQSWWDEPILGRLKDYARFVDYRPDAVGRTAYEARYRFVDTARAKFFFNGFGHDAVDFLFGARRQS